MEHIDINIFNSWAKNHITDDSKFDKNFKSTGIIAKILEDHWAKYYNKYKAVLDRKRPNANKEV